jgi:hypothetical protein
MTYSTQQLIQILDRELQANCKGERILLSWENRIDDPAMAMALDPKQVSKVFAYQDFRRLIHEYQKKYLVSGLIWRVTTFNGQSVRFPELHNQLIAVAGDKEILMAAKESVLTFWREVTTQMNFWLASDRQNQITTHRVEELVQQTEWTEIDATRTEVYLGLCWGSPQEHQYGWAFPRSGCYRIIAAYNQPSSIKL